MDDRQQNKYAMYKRVEAVLTDHSEVWSSHVAFKAGVDAFVANNAKTGKLDEEQASDTTGYTTQRDKQKKAQAEVALEVAGAVSAYASVIGDDALGKKVDFSYSELFYVRDTVAITRANLVYNAASGIIAELSDYGVDAAKLAALKAAIDAFKATVGEKDHAKEDTQTATQLLPPVFDENDEILKDRLDKIMPQFKKDNAHFYNTYFNAREIYDFRGGGGGEPPEEPPAPVG